MNESTARKLNILEKLKEASMSKSDDKKLPSAYSSIKKSCDPTIAWLPI